VANWSAKTGIFSRDQRPWAWEKNQAVDMLTWWRGFFGDTALSIVVSAIASIPVTSAAAERNWSIRGSIHTPARNRYKFLDNI
jgi:hypothetical protein